MNRIRVLVVDDHSVVRRGLRRYFELLPQMEMIAEASSGPEALAAAAAVAPDVILLDLMLPELDGLSTATALKALLPRAPVLILTTFCTREVLRDALRAGANGFLLKDIGVDELALAIHTVLAGRTYLQAQAVEHLLDHPPAHAGAQLTGREREVCELIARGMSNKAIAAALGISDKTASVHASNLMGKLGLRSRTQVARYVLQGELRGAG